MNTCKTCKAWRPVTEHSIFPEKMAGGYCRSMKFGESGGVDFELDGLRYDYAEFGGFWTGPEFGCVHHAPKDER